MKKINAAIKKNFIIPSYDNGQHIRKIPGQKNLIIELSF
ncbi:Uncharacterized protein dnm_074030 [Desulfonema magnum]|uniref:Uncharacterized protein n=1 Tax=Desulfonema magnum TaxID=45655 RepID=A0A975BU66_9BACT|nr:Uncharacterized protein dnm_074030 [Desulfonema magnum]